MLVSIIIPVFNADKYLDFCLRSVVNQSYSNLEILLIDDGSTDDCPQMCEKWKLKDSRIKVVHKQNGGLSSARNLGLDNASGDLLFFLDADDALALDTIDILVDEMRKNNDDITSCSFSNFYKDSEVINDFNNIIFKKGNNELFFLQIISNHACGKLFKRDLFNSVRFPEGRSYEDIATTHYLYEKSNHVSHTDAGLLFYRQHQGTITSNITKKSIDDIKWAYEEIKKKYPCGDKYGFYLLTVLYILHSRIIKSNLKFKTKKNLDEYIRKEFSEIYKSVNIRRFNYSPMFTRLILYRFHLSGMIICVKKLMVKGLKI